MLNTVLPAAAAGVPGATRFVPEPHGTQSQDTSSYKRTRLVS